MCAGAHQASHGLPGAVLAAARLRHHGAQGTPRRRHCCRRSVAAVRLAAVPCHSGCCPTSREPPLRQRTASLPVGELGCSCCRLRLPSRPAACSCCRPGLLSFSCPSACSSSCRIAWRWRCARRPPSISRTLSSTTGWVAPAAAAAAVAEGAAAAAARAVGRLLLPTGLLRGLHHRGLLLPRRLDALN